MCVCVCVHMFQYIACLRGDFYWYEQQQRFVWIEVEEKKLEQKCLVTNQMKLHTQTLLSRMYHWNFPKIQWILDAMASREHWTQCRWFHSLNYYHYYPHASMRAFHSVGTMLSKLKVHMHSGQLSHRINLVRFVWSIYCSIYIYVCMSYWLKLNVPYTVYA